MGIFGRKPDYGKPLYNLRIDLILDAVSFEGKSMGSSFYEGDKLINLAKICSFAKKRLSGPRHVTERGYLFKDFEDFDNISFYEATLNINENLRGLYGLNDLIENKNNLWQSSYVNLLYNNQDHLVKAEGSELYLPLIRENILSKDLQEIEKNRSRAICSK